MYRKYIFINVIKIKYCVFFGRGEVRGGGYTLYLEGVHDPEKVNNLWYKGTVIPLKMFSVTYVYNFEFKHSLKK